MTRFSHIFYLLDTYIQTGSTVASTGFEIYPIIANEAPTSSNDYIIYRYTDSNRYYNSKDMSEHMTVSVDITLISQDYTRFMDALNMVQRNELRGTLNQSEEPNIDFDLTVSSVSTDYNDGYYIGHVAYNFDF